MVRQRERCVPPVHNMKEPAKKKIKINMEEERDKPDEHDFSVIQKDLLKNCLCHIPDAALYNLLKSSDESNTSTARFNMADWEADRILKFLTCLQVLCEVSIKQNSNGMICSRINGVCEMLIKNENGFVDQLIDLLMNNNQFINYSACKALSCFFIMCKKDVETVWLDRIIENALTTHIPIKMSICLDVIKGVIAWKDNSPHPLEDRGRARGRQIFIDPLCNATSLMDTESPDVSEVKSICIKVLEPKWPNLVGKVYEMIRSYTPENEPAIMTFLELWSTIISIKTNFSVMDVKPFYSNLINFFDTFNSDVPSVIRKQLLSLFNEVLCYGTTLALQDYPPEEPRSLAHQVMRFAKDRRLLDPKPFRTGSGNLEDENNATNFNGGSDRVLLQKMALLVLKSVAITVKETNYESSSDDSSMDSETEDLAADMAVIERSIRDVLGQLDNCVKQLLPFHPETPISQWVVQLFADQDDALIEAMVCCMDVTVGLYYRQPTMPPNPSLNPTLTFISFLHVVGHDTNVLIDFLISNETCFLLYLLRILKFISRNWEEFKASCGHEFDDTIALLNRLKIAIERLVEHALFPYNIDPILNLLRKCFSNLSNNR